MNNIFSIVSLVISVSSLTVSIVVFFITRRRQNYLTLYDQMTQFAREEVFIATRRLWELYREYGDNFADRYIKIMEADTKKLKSLPLEKQLAFQRNTLHYQRKILTQFWRNLSIILKNGLLPEKQVYGAWAKDTVEIVPKILLPLENKLADYHKVSRFDPKTEPLYYIGSRIDKFYQSKIEN